MQPGSIGSPRPRMFSSAKGTTWAAKWPRVADMLLVMGTTIAIPVALSEARDTTT